MKTQGEVFDVRLATPVEVAQLAALLASASHARAREALHNPGRTLVA
jgi:hypothetical protein